MMDLCLDIEEYKLNIRAGGIIIHNNKVLLHKNKNKAHYCLPGGRVKIGENSEKAIKREIQEELGKQIEILKFVTTVENFFEMDNKKYHEIYFIYKIDFMIDEDKKIDYTIYNVEGKDYLQYEWIDLNKLDEYNILPECSKGILETKNSSHVINDELL